MSMMKSQSGIFAERAEQPVNKVSLFLAHNGNFILVVRHHAKDNSVSIEPPGGKIDPRKNGDLETHEQALKREAYQEIGLLVKPLSWMMDEFHPYTGKPVAHYYCEPVGGMLHNKAFDEHLGVLEIGLSKLMKYEDIKLVALDAAQKIVDQALGNNQLSRPIDFRVSEESFLKFSERFSFEATSDFTNIYAENSPSSPKPA